MNLNKKNLLSKPEICTRFIWADFSRSVAIFGVIVIHSCGQFFYDFGRISESSWLQATFLDSLVRFSVPIFVMLSGALLLGRKSDSISPESEISEIPKRITRLVLPLVAWSLIYFYHISRDIHNIPILSALTKPAMYHLWFVYMLVGIYLLLPLFNVLYRAILSSKTMAGYFFLLWFLLTSVPIYWKPETLSLFYLTHFFGYGGYFLLGAFLASKAQSLSNKLALLLFLAGVLCTFYLTWQFSEEQKKPIETAFEYFSANVVIASIGAFVLLRNVRIPQTCVRLVQFISDRSFVIYFAHILVLEHVRYNAHVIALGKILPMSATILCIAALTFIFSLLFASLLKAIPGNKHIFG